VPKWKPLERGLVYGIPPRAIGDWHGAAAHISLCLQGDDVEILVITKEGVRTDRLELKRD